MVVANFPLARHRVRKATIKVGKKSALKKNSWGKKKKEAWLWVGGCTDGIEKYGTAEETLFG